MEDINIFSGNIPSAIFTHLSKIPLYRNCLVNADAKESVNYRQSRFEPGSIVVFDSKFNRSGYFKFNDELDYCSDSKNSSRKNGIFNRANCDNQIFDCNIVNLTEQTHWNGNIDVFEQSDNYKKCSDQFNARFYLKKVLGEKNILDLSSIQSKHLHSNSATSLLSNSYNSNFINLGLESDKLLESVRHKLEKADQTGFIHLTTEVNSIYSNVSNKIVEFLDEEAPHSYKPSLSLLVNEETETRIKSLSLNEMLNFANVRFLIDQSKYCDDIWLMDLDHIKGLVENNLNTNFDPLIALAFVVDQTSVSTDLNSTQINPLSLLGRSVGHPFRNIAIFNTNKFSKNKNVTRYIKQEGLESICTNYFLDICQSEYVGLDSLNPSEIISIANENPYIFWRETREMIDYLNKYTNQITPLVYNSVSSNTFPISVY